MSNLRRSQSLKDLSGVQERSWVTSSLWDKKKSVSQLVQKYQSCAELQKTESAEPNRCEASETRGSSVLGHKESRETRGGFPLSRSRSMGYLPPKEPEGTSALRALFESKIALRQDCSSSPRLSGALPASNKEEQRHPVVKRPHSTAETPVKKDNPPQRVIRSERRQTATGVPESCVRSSPNSQDDKRHPKSPSTETPSRPGRERSSTSASVRDRSALYLSKVAAADPTGGSTRLEFTSSPEKKTTKLSKFQSPAKEMCSACLTPVYPMERMMANNLVLHYNCFCCKHCKKKLSIRNYSSLYGEFYCIFHYQQLFKTKGNYDEGFGHKQHKDRWLQKTEATEPDQKVPQKATKASLVVVDRSVEIAAAPSAPLPSKKTLANNGTDNRNKLKKSWPPEKKEPRGSPAQLVKTRQSVSLTDQQAKEKSWTSSISEKHTDRNITKRDQVEVRPGQQDKTSSKDLTQKSNKTLSHSTEMSDSNKSKPWSVSFRRTLFQEDSTTTAVDFSSSPAGKSFPLKKQTRDHMNVTPPAIKKRNSEEKNNFLSKAKKSVRFAQNTDPNLIKQSPSELSSGVQTQNQSELWSDDESNEEIVDSRNNKDFDASTEELESEVTPNSNANNPNDTMDGLGRGQVYASKGFNADEDIIQEKPQPNSPVQINKDSMSLKRHTVNPRESPVVKVTHAKKKNKAERSEEVSDGTEVFDVFDSGDQKVSKAQPEPGFKETLPIISSSNEKQLQNNTQVKGLNSGGLRGVQRANSLKEKQTETTPIKRGSWSKGKSPLSKLFITGSNEKSNEVEPADKKKHDPKSKGILGKLFQSSSEKDIKKTDEAKPKEQDGTKQTMEKPEGVEGVKEDATEKQKHSSISKLLRQEGTEVTDIISEDYFNQSNEILNPHEERQNDVRAGTLFELEQDAPQSLLNPLDLPEKTVRSLGDTKAILSPGIDILSAGVPAVSLTTHTLDVFDQVSKRPDENHGVQQESLEGPNPTLFGFSTPIPPNVDLDIFNTEQSTASIIKQDGAEIPDDIFGMNDSLTNGSISTQRPSQSNTNNFDDFLALDDKATAPPAVQSDFFHQDILTSESVISATSPPSDPNAFMDSFFDPNSSGSSPAPIAAPNTDNSWMDDLLG